MFVTVEADDIVSAECTERSEGWDVFHWAIDAQGK